MKRIKYFVFVALCLMIGHYASAQVYVTSHANDSVKTILENHFLGGGIQLSNVKFNGNVRLNNTNQFGTFTNADISGHNIKLHSGLCMSTGTIEDMTCGKPAVHSSVASPTSENYSNAGAQALHTLIMNLMGVGYADKMHDIASLNFDFISFGNSISFKYVFGSDEYPAYVCSNYNDGFGIFISGPFLDDGETPANLPSVIQYNNENIAQMSELDSTPVTINTLNGGIAAGSNTTCVLTNTSLFIGNNPVDDPSGNHSATNTLDTISKIQGYSVAMNTKKIVVAPCYKYHIEISVCDVSDNSFNSGVFLGANSFRSDVYDVKGECHGNILKKDTITKSPCDSVVLSVKLNRVVGSTEVYTYGVETDMVEGEDYEPFSTSLTFNSGDTIAKTTIHFLESENDVAGDMKYMTIIPAYFNSCSPNDTIFLKAKVFAPLSFDSYTPNKLYPHSTVFPVTETVFARAINGIGHLTYTWRDVSTGDLIGTNPHSDTNHITINGNTTVSISVSDSCGGVIEKYILFYMDNGLSEIELGNAQMSLYPNPATKETTLKLSPVIEDTEVNVFDMQGRRVMYYMLHTGASELKMDCSSLTQGVYMVRTGKMIRKLVIQ